MLDRFPEMPLTRSYVSRASALIVSATVLEVTGADLISTTWAGEVLPREPRQLRRWNYPGRAGVSVARGDAIGQFNLGSTVILLLPRDVVVPAADLRPGQPLRVL